MSQRRRLLPLLFLGSFLALASHTAAEPAGTGKADGADEPPRVDPTTIPQGTPASEVRHLLGVPKHVSRQILDGRYVEQWTYDGPTSIRLEFDWRKGEEKRLQRVQAPRNQPR
jgi:hypothetical protein